MLFDWLQSWDCAFKGTDTSDYVVGQVWARDRRNPTNRYLIDQVRGHMNFSETLSAIQNLSAKWPQSHRKLIEDKANGTAIMDVLKGQISGMVPVEPHGGKVVRANAVTAQVEAGNVYLPKQTQTPWIGDFIEEFAAFPNGKHDDQVDAMTQANAYYNGRTSFNIKNMI
jgi:predicted phage terminase large subunit-like protein